MRATTLRFLLGDKYVEEERKQGWSIEGFLDKDKVDGKSVSADKGKNHFGVNMDGGKGKEKLVNSRKIQIVPGKGLVIDLVSDDEDSSQTKGENPEKNASTENRLAKSLEEERKKMQAIIATAWETEKEKNAAELAFKEENTRRIKAELALSAEVRRIETIEQLLEEEKKKTAEEKKAKLSQEKIWKEDQHWLEDYKKASVQAKTEIKSLASAAQQYINVLEAGCNARMLEFAKGGTSSKRWMEMYEKIHNLSDELYEISKQQGLVENLSPLEESLMIEKKKRAEVLAELEVARELTKNVTKNFQSEWRQVETLQRQIRELKAKAMDPQKALSELKARNDTVEQSLQRERRFIGVLQQQLNNEKKESERVTALLEKERRNSLINGVSSFPPNRMGLTADAVKEIEDLKKSLAAEKARSEWFREQFADQQNISIARDGVYEELQEEKKRREAVEKALEVEKKLREITERTLNDERNRVGGNPGAGVKAGAERVLAEVKQEVLNERARVQTAASEPSSSKKRKSYSA